MEQQLIPAILESIRSNWELPALSDFEGTTYRYKDVARHIAEVRILFRALGLRPGDRVAVCAKNSAAWAVTFLAGLSYGAVVVPLLHEFHPDSIESLVTHSEARVLFTEKGIAEKLDQVKMPLLEAEILMPGFEVVFSRNEKLAETAASLDARFAELYPAGLDREAVNCHIPEPGEMALINYTSGSTGNPKGVMLSYKNLWSNVRFGLERIDFLMPGDSMLSMLPLAHMYGLVFEFLFPFCKGCHITFLGRVPSPNTVLKAFEATRPKLVITVPLVIEKIVRAKVFAALRKPLMRFLTAVPLIRGLVYRKVRGQLLEAFGGNLRQLILGGAALSPDVEDFLRKIRFPFTIGYGMTECAPLITYEWWATARPRSCGRLTDRMEARILSDDRFNVPGVLFVKGDNVMMGYYKNPEATVDAMCPEGWLKTGDICTIDRDGYIYIRGRDKNMILTSSGQNVYPEEIESVVNRQPVVAESVVVDRGGKIVALVHPDYEAARKRGMTPREAEAAVIASLPAVNKQLPAYARVAEIEIRPEEFEKTPKHSIRRFLYK
ncbi:MAG: AMP-binding protein [Muribaculaceae bacterium]|nr:AMP-binding protein [Muribaculaceae bacterium]